jgi:hypothetical protein
MSWRWPAWALMAVAGVAAATNPAAESCDGTLGMGEEPTRGGGSCKPSDEFVSTRRAAPSVDEMASMCWLNGGCEDWVCVCDSGWTGPQCELLDLLPADDPETG